MIKMLEEAGHIKNTVVLIFQNIQCLHLMYSEVAWVLVSLETQVHPHIILDLFYFPDYPYVSYDHDWIYCYHCFILFEFWRISIHFDSIGFADNFNWMIILSFIDVTFIVTTEL